MEGTDFYIYIVISLLGIAYPLLLQVIARLDEKYSSDHIVSLFDKEFEGKAFRYALYASLFFIVIWTLDFQPVIEVEGLNFLIDNSAAILLAVATMALVIAFFLLVRKILIYYTPTKFIQYLRSNHSQSKVDFSYFEALSDMLLLSIKKQQRNITLTLSDFFYTAFKLERERSQYKPVVYPELYYEVVHKSIEELAILKEKRNLSLEHRTGGSVWLLGELQGSEISGRTYTWIWRNLVLITQYGQDDMIVYHWETAHQFYAYSLQSITPDYGSLAGSRKVGNEEAIEKRRQERERFIEFHYALGGLLLYREMYNCIRRIFIHTNSQPPKYELLPDSMHEVFKAYSWFRDPYDINYPWISNVYPFPKQSGLNADGVIKRWISSYMALLFLRQYTLISYSVNSRPLSFPQIPSTQGEIKEWIDGIDFFRKLVSEHLENPDLIRELNLSFLTAEWCKDNGTVYPTDYIDDFKGKLQSAYHANARTIPLSADKIAQFENKTRDVVEDLLATYSALSNPATIQGESDIWVVKGQQMLQSKDAFAENPEVHHMNFDSFLAYSIAGDIKDRISSTFLFKKTKSFLLKPEDIFPAINKLNIDEKFVIVCFGFHMSHFIDHLKVEGLAGEKYRDTQIVTFNSSRFVGSSMFILRNTDLPVISTRGIPQDIVDKYSLNKISDTIELYASVIDLNKTTPEILKEAGQGKEEEELKKSVLVSIILATEIRWRKRVELIELNLYSEYDQKGLPNTLNEIMPIR